MRSRVYILLAMLVLERVAGGLIPVLALAYLSSLSI